MRIYVRVKTRKREGKVHVLPDGKYEVHVIAVPERGKANAEVQMLLAKHFGVAKSRIDLVGGATVSEKIFDVDA